MVVLCLLFMVGWVEWVIDWVVFLFVSLCIGFYCAVCGFGMVIECFDLLFVWDC